jgi:hypothetical protein
MQQRDRDGHEPAAIAAAVEHDGRRRLSALTRYRDGRSV